MLTWRNKLARMKDLYFRIIECLDESMTPMEVSRELNIPVEMVLEVLEKECV